MGVAAIPYIAMAVAAGAEYKNTQNTANRQDQAAAAAIQNQAGLQKQADSQVNQAVQKIAGSSAQPAIDQRTADYMDVLRRNKATVTQGLTPSIGGSAFKADAANAAEAAQAYGNQNAGLMAQIDAPQMQRQGESFDYGKLATDLGLIGRQSQGQSFLDQVRMNGIRRNPKIDLGAGLLSAYAGSAAGAAGKGASAGAGGAFNGATGAGTYTGAGSTATSW